MFWNERGKCPKVSDAVCFSPRLPISQIGQNEKLLSLISICVAASGEQSQHKKDNIYHNFMVFQSEKCCPPNSSECFDFLEQNSKHIDLFSQSTYIKIFQ